jgi:hypothetical protein
MVTRYIFRKCRAENIAVSPHDEKVVAWLSELKSQLFLNLTG